MEPNLASYIDHTLLKPDVTPEQIEILCREAAEHRFFGVCINSSYIALAKKTLSGTPVKVVSVIGFPLGVMETSAKAFEAQRAVQLGADEIDMVIHIGQLKAGNFSYVKEDIKAVVTAAQGKPVKVILETCLLSEEQKRKACEISVDAGAHFD